jgi:hypothetical protein
MNTIFYITATSETQEWMDAVIKMMPAEASAELYRTIGSLSGRLRRPSEGLTIAVLVAGDRKDLANFISIRDLLFEIPVILILPDRAADITAAGFSLVPRFLTYADGNKSEVGAVLEKMFANYKKNRAWGTAGAGNADIKDPKSISPKFYGRKRLSHETC